MDQSGHPVKITIDSPGWDMNMIILQYGFCLGILWIQS